QSGGSGPSRHPAATAVRFGRGRKTCGLPGHHQTNGWPAVRRTRGRRARPGPRTGQ
nr:hypothetical protein [Tanacetum cinerariifolium]